MFLGAISFFEGKIVRAGGAVLANNIWQARIAAILVVCFCVGLVITSRKKK